MFSALQDGRQEYDPAMRRILISLAFIAGPVDAQVTTPPAAPTAQAPVAPAAPSASTAVWDPAAGYITVGQDEPGYRSWYLAAPSRAAQVKSFNDYLATYQVFGIVPTWQLLRTATAWKDCGGQPFEVPPPTEWPHMVQTLRYVHDYVIPEVGPVEPVSVYRNPALNQCAGGAPESAHKTDSAIDMVPLRPITREALMKSLCTNHSEHGAAYNAGLGFYAYLRFHVDSTKFRRWNMDPAVAAQCPPIVHPEDIATVGQPITPGPATPAPQAPAVASAPVATAPATPPRPSATPPSRER
jgi:hypothetical protein